jgi:hypothetical protein
MVVFRFDWACRTEEPCEGGPGPEQPGPFRESLGAFLFPSRTAVTPNRCRAGGWGATPGPFFKETIMSNKENAVGLCDMPRIIDLVREWSITTKREIIRDKNGKATGAKDTKVENIGNRVADMLDHIYELMVTIGRC